MHPLATVVISAVAAAAVAFVVSAQRSAINDPSSAGPGLAQEVAELRDATQRLQQQLAALANAPAPVAAASALERTVAPVLGKEQIAAAVEAYLAQRRGDGSPSSPSMAPQFDLDAEFDRLRSVSYDRDPELWKRLHAAGKGDEALARLEALVQANPRDVQAQMALANACLSYMRIETGRYELAMRADRAFDDVLAVDDKHWEARFTKAVSYSFWPPITGKPKQAVEHLDKLVAQQETMPPQPHEAQTYLILGNLLEPSDPARAREVWAKGARRHPDHAELAKKLGR